MQFSSQTTPAPPLRSPSTTRFLPRPTQDTRAQQLNSQPQPQQFLFQPQQFQPKQQFQPQQFQPQENIVQTNQQVFSPKQSAIQNFLPQRQEFQPQQFISEPQQFIS